MQDMSDKDSMLHVEKQFNQYSVCFSFNKVCSRTCELKTTEDFRNMFLIHIPEF